MAALASRDAVEKCQRFFCHMHTLRVRPVARCIPIRASVKRHPRAILSTPGRIAAPFPLAVAHRLRLTAPAAVIEWPRFACGVLRERGNNFQECGELLRVRDTRARARASRPSCCTPGTFHICSAPAPSRQTIVTNTRTSSCRQASIHHLTLLGHTKTKQKRGTRMTEQNKKPKRTCTTRPCRTRRHTSGALARRRRRAFYCLRSAEVSQKRFAPLEGDNF